MKKVVAVLLVLVVAVGLFAGCETFKTAEQETSSEQGEKSENATSSVGQKKDVVIRGYGLEASYSETMEQFVEDFNNLQNGITIEWEIPPDEPYTVLKTRFASGEAPDIFDLAPGDLGAWGEKCADLSNESFLNTIHDSAKESVTFEGKVIGFPYAMEGSGFVYNIELFEQAGIEEFPKTLDELEALCKKLQSAGIQPFGEAWKEWGYLMHIFGTPFAYEENEQEVCNKLNKGEIKISDLTYMNNFFRLFDMTLEYGKGVESVGYGVTDQIADFASGKMAMTKQGSWIASYYLGANPDLKIGLFAIPLTNNPEDTKLMTTATRYLVANKDSENVNESKVFINWLYENIQEYFVDGVKLTAPYDGLDLSKLSSLNSDMYTYMEKGKAFSTFGNMYWPSGFKVDLATPLQGYAAGVKDKEATLSEIQKLYENRVIEE